MYPSTGCYDRRVAFASALRDIGWAAVSAYPGEANRSPNPHRPDVGTVRIAEVYGSALDPRLLR